MRRQTCERGLFCGVEAGGVERGRTGLGEPVVRSRRSQAGAGQALHRGTGPNTFNTASGCSVEKELRRARVVARSRAGERRLLGGQGRWWGRGTRDVGWLESGEGSLVRV